MNTVIKAKKIEAELAKILPLGIQFIDNGYIKFSSRHKAKEFLVLFLLLESVAGTNYSYLDLWQNYQKIKKVVQKNTIIYSENLPILRNHEDKELVDVEYTRMYKVCTYKRVEEKQKIQ